MVTCAGNVSIIIVMSAIIRGAIVHTTYLYMKNKISAIICEVSSHIAFQCRFHIIGELNYLYHYTITFVNN